MMNQLEYENHQVLDLVNALLGVISSNMRLISLVPQGEAALFRFLLKEESEKDREEIEDILSEYSALRLKPEEDKIEIIVIGERDLVSEDLKGRVVYIQKPNQ